MIAEIEWGDNLRISNLLVDFQHEMLCKRYNKLLRATMAKGDHEFIGYLLDDLISYTIYHFRSEELLMRKTDYPNFDFHVGHHTAFLSLCEKVKKDYLENNEPLSLDVLKTVKRWVAGHILGDDMAMGEHFLKFPEEQLEEYMRVLEQDLNPECRKNHSFVDGIIEVKEQRSIGLRLIDWSKNIFSFPMFVCVSFSFILIISNVITSISTFLWVFIPYFVFIIILVISVSLIGVCAISFSIKLVMDGILAMVGKLIDNISGMDDLKEKKTSLRPLSMVTTNTTLQTSLNNLLRSLENYSKYVPLDFLQSIVRKHEVVTVGLDSRYVTILFNDIANFTTLCEGIDPLDLVQFLHNFFKISDSAVWNCEGLVISQTGDGIMALWNAPKWCLEHEEKAVRCAIEINERMNEYVRTREESSFRQINIRFGINSTSCLVGNIGSESRLSYNVFGDGVNAAARLEGANKYYGTNILISSSTFMGINSLAKEKYLFRWVDIVCVKGKSVPLSIFEVRKKESIKEGYIVPESESESDTIVSSMIDKVEEEETEGEDEEEHFVGSVAIIEEEKEEMDDLKLEKICDISMYLMKAFLKGKVRKSRELCEMILSLNEDDVIAKLMKERLDGGVCDPSSLTDK